MGGKKNKTGQERVVKTDAGLRLTGLRAAVVYAYLVYAPYYLIWRLDTFNPNALVFSWFIWGAEVFGYLTALLHVFMVWQLTSPEAEAPPPGWTVDVFIPTYNESVQLVRHTLLAAKQMDYPHEVWLLDDGNRKEMAALAQEYGCRYLARTVNTDAKAGNLNNALAHSRADFIALFDADHVPNHGFLVKTLGFFRDPKVAFVQTPQEFYNLDSFQHRRRKHLGYVWTEQSLFYRVIQRGKDRWNAAFFCGSCAVLRRSAIDAIGGFATGTVTEDLHTSLRLHKKGYRSVYFPESLAFGLAPDSVEAFLLQRRRWCQGAIQVWRKEGILFTRGLTFAQRMNYLASVLTYFESWQKLLFYTAPAVVLLTGVMPISVFGLDFFVRFAPFYVLCFWAFEEAGRGYGGTLLTEQYNMARFATFLQATITGFRDHLKFRVTPKNSIERSERQKMLPQISVIALSLVGITIGGVLWREHAHLSPGAFWANVVWSFINIGFAGAIVRFSFRKRHQRREYRFPIPFPALVKNEDGSTVVCLVEDISIDGFRLVTETPMGEGKHVSGDIYLPGSSLGFRGKLLRKLTSLDNKPKKFQPDEKMERHPRAKHVYGVAFEWSDTRQTVQLHNLLYGTNLQWNLLGLHEDITTPVDWLLTKMRKDKVVKLSEISIPQWLPVIYRELVVDAVGTSRFGVVSRTRWADEPAQLILFDPLTAPSKIEMYVFGNVPRDALAGRVSEVRKFEVGTNSVYLGSVAVEHSGNTAPPRRRWRGFSMLAAVSGATLLGLFMSMVVAEKVVASEWIALGGGEVAGNSAHYLYAGAVGPLRANDALGRGWAQRYWLDWVDYKYDANGQTVRAKAPGASFSVGFQGSNASGSSWASYVGVGYRRTSLNPYQPASKAQGGQTTLQWLGETVQPLSENSRFSGAAQLGFWPNSHWLRGRFLTRWNSRALWHGLEAVLQGDSEYDIVKLGYAVEGLSVNERTSMGFKFGVQKNKGLSSEAYLGIEFGRSF